MDRRRDPRYKQQEAHHYDDRYNNTYDNYDYEEDYGNQYANTGKIFNVYTFYISIEKYEF